MKTLYNALAKRIKEIDAVKWVDFNTGQLEQAKLRPTVDFPAVLIDIAYPSCNNFGTSGVQQCAVSFTLTLAYWTEAHSFEGINEDMKLDALGVFDIINSLQDNLQDWQGSPDEFVFNSPLVRTAVNPVANSSELKVYELRYTTTHIDNHTAAKKYKTIQVTPKIVKG